MKKTVIFSVLVIIIVVLTICQAKNVSSEETRADPPLAPYLQQTMVDKINSSDPREMAEKACEGHIPWTGPSNYEVSFDETANPTTVTIFITPSSLPASYTGLTSLKALIEVQILENEMTIWKYSCEL